MSTDRLRAELLRADDAEPLLADFYRETPPQWFYQQSAWVEALHAGFDIDPMWLVWTCEEAVVGVLPVTYSLKRPNRLVSLPFSHPVRPAWKGAVPDDAWTVGWEAIRRFDFEQWVVKEVVPGGERQELPYKRSVVALEGSLDDVRQRYRGNTRTAIRQAERAGLSARLWVAQDEGLLKTFIDTHHRRLAIPTLPTRWIRALERLLETRQMRCLLVEQDQQTLAIAIDLPGTTCVGTFACSVADPELLRLRPNDLLRDASLAAAHADGSAFFDLGSSHESEEGQLHHKRGFGAVEEPVGYTFFGMSPPTAGNSRGVSVSKTLLRVCPALFYPALSRLMIRSTEW